MSIQIKQHYPNDSLFDITVLLETVCPEKLLIIGENEILNIHKQYQLQCEVIKKPFSCNLLSSSTQLSEPALMQRYDLAIIGNILESKSKQECQQLLGRLRDLCTPRLILIADLDNTEWLENELLGFGFSKFCNAERGIKERNIVIYQYNIDSYKKTPDWFNPKNWANPNLWNKFWW